jgi:CRISPR-associated protein Csm5
MRYTVEVISPIHIGTGDVIHPIEYIIDDKFYRVDMDNLFKDEAFDNEAFIRSAKDGRLYLGELAPDLGKKYVRYALELSPLTKKKLQSLIGSPSAEIREFIKTSGMAYIPGSSLKGAIRTAILWWVLKNNPNMLNKAKNVLSNLIKSSNKDKRRIDDEIEKLVFGKDPTHDLLKALQVSDTNAISVKKLKVKEIRTLTTKSKGHGWKGFLTFVEALKDGTSLTLDICLNEFFLRENIAEKLRFSNKQNILKNLPKICNTFAKDFIEDEIKFFEEYNTPKELDNIVAFYNGLKHDAKRLGDDAFLVHFAWGSGWRSMTVGSLFDIKALREAFDLGKNIKRSYCKKCNSQLIKKQPTNKFYNFCPKCHNYLKINQQYQKIKLIWPFPKTRKIVIEDGKPKYPLGWVKLRLIE